MTASVADNSDFGLNAETAACENWPLERISGDADEPDQFDARFSEDFVGDGGGLIVAAGTPVEVKTCRLAYDQRKGRWWIRRDNHERLLQDGGEYVLSVYKEATGEILRQRLVSAQIIDSLIDQWWAAGNGHHETTEEFVQLPWSKVFNGVSDADD